MDEYIISRLVLVYDLIQEGNPAINIASSVILLGLGFLWSFKGRWWAVDVNNYHNYYYTLDNLIVDACTVPNADCVLGGVNETGQITSGHIEISGPIIESIVILEDGSWYIDRELLDRVKKRYNFLPDYNYEKPGPYRSFSGSPIYYLGFFSFKLPEIYWPVNGKRLSTFIILRKLEWGDIERIGHWSLEDVSNARNKLLENPMLKETVARIIWERTDECLTYRFLIFFMLDEERAKKWVSFRTPEIPNSIVNMSTSNGKLRVITYSKI